MAARRGHGDDSIYWDESKNRHVGAISLGWSADGQRRIRRKVRGRTKTEVRDKLRELRSALDGGIRPSARYTVQQAVDDWLEHGLDGRSPKTLSTIREVLAPVTKQIGKVKLQELTATDVRVALAEVAKAGPRGQCKRHTVRWSGRSPTPRQTTWLAGTWPRSSRHQRGKRGLVPRWLPGETPDSGR